MNQQASSPPDETPNGPVLGMVSALHLEVSSFLQRTEQFKSQSGNGFTFRGCQLDETRICLVEGGMGASRAVKATTALIDAYQPPWVLSVGFSGALIDGMKVGDIVVANGITNETGEIQLAIDLKMRAAPEQGLYVGKLCSSSSVVRLVTEKRQLAAITGAIAVDMESLSVAQVCRQRKTRFMAVRVISDDLSEDLPAEVTALVSPKGTVRAGALFGAIIRRPGCIKDLFALREKSEEAAKKLGAFLPGIIKVLASTK
ncbi:5'-methylthioadenosine nucleosidase [Planctomicrobium sp. SH668]|uniref:phosphorylase family protein n=1 Tax=Planctomicrobium sp. SH668 TaxID=3448126 RepID=UPI003F5B7224